MRIATVAMLVACGGGGGGAQPDAAPLPDAAAPTVVYEVQGLVVEGVMNGSDLTAWDVGAEMTPYFITARDDGPCHVDDRTKMGFQILQDDGTVTISGGSGSAIVMTPDAQEVYAGEVDGLAYAPGDAITISATGSAAPAFSGSLTFPAEVGAPVTIPVTVSKSAGVTVTWGAVDTPVHVIITQVPDNARTLSVDCTFDGSTGTATIPASSLAELLVQSANLGVGGIARMTSSAGMYAVELEAANHTVVGSVEIGP